MADVSNLQSSCAYVDVPTTEVVVTRDSSNIAVNDNYDIFPQQIVMRGILCGKLVFECMFMFEVSCRP